MKYIKILQQIFYRITVSLRRSNTKAVETKKQNFKEPVLLKTEVEVEITQAAERTTAQISKENKFLICPIKGDDDQGSPLTSRTVKISSVLDHSGTAIDPQSNNQWGKNAKNQKVKAFNGEIGEGKQCPQEPCGYPKNNLTEFFQNKEINYVGVSYDGGKYTLQYDGHAGYDFPYPLLTPIAAPADGDLYKVAQGADSIYGACWDKDHSFYIRHDNGFVTWFRHCTNLADNIEAVIGDNFKKTFRVKSGDLIASSGNFESWKKGGTSAHLHFEVRDKNDKIIDPYAKNLWKI